MQFELDFPLVHQPVNPPRENHREEMYARTWSVWATAHPPRAHDDLDATHFDWMFSDLPWVPGQQEALVAASLMCWLGTNCGQGFLDDVRRLQEVIGSQYAALQAVIGSQYAAESAFSMQWALENQRRPSVNHGRRILEFCLTAREKLNAGEVEALTGRDFEAAECVMAWLGTLDGQMFLHACKSECVNSETRERAARKSARMG